MKTILLSFLILFFALNAWSQSEWKPVAGKMMTEWGEKVNPAKPLPEYPRPQLVRNDWMNLNGLWQYSILPKTQESIPLAFEGNILVPFAVESTLSGVGKTVGKDSVLWYERGFSLPASFKNQACTAAIRSGRLVVRCICKREESRHAPGWLRSIQYGYYGRIK